MKNIWIDKINKNEVLRYIGYKGRGIELDLEIQNKINQAIIEVADIMETSFRFTYTKKDIYRFNNSLFLNGNINNIYLDGNNMKSLLKNSKNCIIGAVTLGTMADRRIRYYEKCDMSMAVIFDGCCSVAVEAGVDELCKDIEDKLKVDGLSLTRRFSAGYGDFPLSMQRKFIDELKTQTSIGLTVTDSNILIPTKSITFIMGTIKGCNENTKSENCNLCSMNKQCSYRKDI